MHMHGQDIARDISMFGTSKKTPRQSVTDRGARERKKEWLQFNERKAKMNTMLSNFENMICTGTLYATLRCTHFVEAQKLVMEGGGGGRTNKTVLCSS